MTRNRFLLSGCLLGSGLVFAACADEQPPTPDALDEALVVAQGPAFFTLAEFEASYDAETGEFTLDVLDPQDLAGDEFRTERQGYGFCNDFAINIDGGAITMQTFLDSLGYTPAECIDPIELDAWDDLFYTAGGAFCATIRVINDSDGTMENVIAEITEITTGYEGYTYQEDAVPPCCGTGAALGGYEGQNVPTDLTGGAFLHATSLAPGEHGDRQWTLQNAGGSFTLSGHIAAQVSEGSSPNGADDDCDGIIDNATNSFLEGAACRENADCSSADCADIVPETGFGVCAGDPCPAGTFGPACDPCPSCVNGTCNSGFGGDGTCACDGNWAGDLCDDCAPGFYGADCSSACGTCGDFGVCSDGVLGDGSCDCLPGGHGATCEFSCTDGVQNGDEEDIDCGGATCADCGPTFDTDCNLNGIPGGAIGSIPTVHLPGDPCVEVSPGICLARGTNNPWYNEAIGETTGSSRTTPTGLYFAEADCATAEADPTLFFAGFRDQYAGTFRSWTPRTFCLADLTNESFHEVSLDQWGSSRMGGEGFTLSVQGPVCLCDPGFHGFECEFSCTDGLLNGDEEAIDCGGACDACPTPEEDPGVLCNFRGDGTITEASVVHVDGDACYSVSDGVCLNRTSSGGPIFNEAAGQTGGGWNPSHLTGTQWDTNTCDVAIPSAVNWGGGMSNSSTRISEHCMLDESTGNLHDINITAWENWRTGGWSFDHTFVECACDPGFHGGTCQFSCSDGVQNGTEDAIDCGGPCDACTDGWECNFLGELVPGTITVELEGDKAFCDQVDDGVCLNRGGGGPVWNQAVHASTDQSSSGDYDSLSQSAWLQGNCADVDPTDDSVHPFIPWMGNNSGWMLGEWCVYDTTTATEHDLNVTAWGRSRTGTFHYERQGEVCSCFDANNHGPRCEFACDDGVLNGDELDVDCGGPCGACPVGWDCNFNGISGDTTTVFSFDADVDSCDEISAGVCLARGNGTGGGLYNVYAEGSWNGWGPEDTMWGYGDCSTSPAIQYNWREVAYLDGGSGGRDTSGDSFCMLDQTTGLYHTITFTSWASGRVGDFAYERHQACDCDAGFHPGGDCSDTCTDGTKNGDEEDVDCGGSLCDPCDATLYCNGNGATGERVAFQYDGSLLGCDPISDGVCLGRLEGGGLVNFASDTSWDRGSTPSDTRWAHGFCHEVTPGSSFHTAVQNAGIYRRREMPGETFCMLDTTTGLSHNITFDYWFNRRAARFGYTRHEACICDAGFHGNDCSNTCTDGIQNGSEDHIDCGGPCDPCADGWECDFLGLPVIGVESVDLDGSGAECDQMTNTVCFDRTNSGGPFFNEAQSTGGSRNESGLVGTLWASGLCDVVDPTDAHPFLPWMGNSSGWMLGDWCVLDEATGLEYDFEITAWGSGRSGTMSYTREGLTCDCYDADAHGSSCEFSCSDGIMNGAEEATDCGDVCGTVCGEGWECNFRGAVGDLVSFTWDGVTCDPVSDGVCIARGTENGPYNTVTDAAWDWGDEGPEGTRWMGGACGAGTPGQTWRQGVSYNARSLAGTQSCMLDTTTGIEHTIDWTGWDCCRGGGGFSYDRQAGCLCDDPVDVHGSACEFSCSDGVQNGNELHIDCGGPCDPCGDDIVCNFNGTFDGTYVLYQQVGGSGECDEVSPDLCITRGTSAGLYNSVFDGSYDWGDEGPQGTGWDDTIACGGFLPPSLTWRDAGRNDSRRMYEIADPNLEFCMVDDSTGDEWTVRFLEWGQGRGDFTYERFSGSGCICDPGFSGDDCSASCSDGFFNGDEEGTDCGTVCGVACP